MTQIVLVLHHQGQLQGGEPIEHAIGWTFLMIEYPEETPACPCSTGQDQRCAGHGVSVADRGLQWGRIWWSGGIGRKHITFYSMYFQTLLLTRVCPYICITHFQNKT